MELTKPELERFIDEKVKAGDFASPQAVVEDALVRMMQDEHALTDEDVSAINDADDEMDRGEHVEFDAFSAEMRKKYNR